MLEIGMRSERSVPCIFAASFIVTFFIGLMFLTVHKVTHPTPPTEAPDEHHQLRECIDEVNNLCMCRNQLRDTP